MPNKGLVTPAATALQLLEQFALAHGVTVAELLSAASDAGPSVPAWAFASDRTPLETIAFALAEQGLSHKAIGAAIARPNSTVVNALKGASTKSTAKKPAKVNAYVIPVSSLRDTRISPAEAVVAHLRERYKLTNIQTARVLGRDQRNTWQLYSAAVKKRGGRT